ncbi:hypothetical protein KJ654_00140 [Patescibacteria group bacterium]|nr:hypothetical protein [Patescibacteria group bacterium]MBU1966844.1 hypothetical protein [Patescibacteria group bacterium]
MKKTLIILGAGLIFAACIKTSDSPVSPGGGQGGGLGGDQAPVGVPAAAPAAVPAAAPAAVPAAEQKRGDTSKTGMITQSGTTFFLNVTGQQAEIIESYAVDLSAYVGQTVTVTGQYSGDTLFVGKVE